MTQSPPREDLDWTPRAAAFAQGLVDAGAIVDPTWQHVFATVPRHVLVPTFWALDEYNSPATLVVGDDPDQQAAWLDAV